MSAENFELERLLGARGHLLACRVGAALLWMLHVVTPMRLWARYVVPGRLVVVTTSDTAREAIQDSLRLQQARRFFRVHEVLEVSKMEPTASRRQFVAPLAGAWEVQVARGSERAVLLELEVRVAARLERAGGYEGVDSRVSRMLARQAMTAHQARRVRASGVVLDPPQPIKFTQTHEDYLRLLELGPNAEATVEVAILDTPVRPDHLPPEVRSRFRTGPMSDRVRAFEPSDHGAITASIIGSVAPTARIEAFTVMGRKEIVPETSIINSLQTTQARVICMCVEFVFPPNRRQDSESVIETTLRGMGPNRVVVVASGNANGPRDPVEVGFPARCPTVLTVGAVDGAYVRPTYSRFTFPAGSRPLYVMAPGGRKAGTRVEEFAVLSGQSPRVGTSVAAAYAAGVVARSLAVLEGNPARQVETRLLFDGLVHRAMRDFAGYEPGEYGRGMIRCLRQEDISARAVPDDHLREQLRRRIDTLLEGDGEKLRALAQAVGIEAH